MALLIKRNSANRYQFSCFVSSLGAFLLNILQMLFTASCSLLRWCVSELHNKSTLHLEPKVHCISLNHKGNQSDVTSWIKFVDCSCQFSFDTTETTPKLRPTFAFCFYTADDFLQILRMLTHAHSPSCQN